MSISSQASLHPHRQSRRNRLPRHPHGATAGPAHHRRAIPMPMPRRCSCRWRMRPGASARPRRARAISTPTRSSPSRASRAPPASIPAMASSRRMPTSPRPAPQAGIVFVGPPASAIRAMGLKDAAKALVEKASVPVVPGYHGAEQGVAFLRRGCRADWLSRADQGGGRRRRQGHEEGRPAGGFRGGAGQRPARGPERLRRCARAGREIRAEPAPCRNPGLRRQPWQCRASVRA